MHHWCYAALQRDSPCIRIHISEIKVHTFIRASSYNFLPPTLHAHAETALFVFFISPSFQLFSCFILDADRGTWMIFCNCWPTSAYMLIFECKLDRVRVYVVICSLRVSIQDWVAEACAPMPDASKSLVGASTQCTPIYPNVHEDCTWPRSKYLSAFAHWR